MSEIIRNLDTLKKQTEKISQAKDAAVKDTASKDAEKIKKPSAMDTLTQQHQETKKQIATQEKKIDAVMLKSKVLNQKLQTLFNNEFVDEDSNGLDDNSGLAEDKHKAQFEDYKKTKKDMDDLNIESREMRENLQLLQTISKLQTNVMDEMVIAQTCKSDKEEAELAIKKEKEMEELAEKKREEEEKKTMDYWINSAKDKLNQPVKKLDGEVYDEYFKGLVGEESLLSDKVMPEGWDTLPENVVNPGKIEYNVTGDKKRDEKTVAKPEVVSKEVLSVDYVDLGMGATGQDTTIERTRTQETTTTKEVTATSSLVGNSKKYSFKQNPVWVNEKKEKATKYITKEDYNNWLIKKKNYNSLDTREKAALIYDMLKKNQNKDSVKEEEDQQGSASALFELQKKHKLNIRKRNEELVRGDMKVQEMESGVILAYSGKNPTKGAMRFDPNNNCWIPIIN